MIKNSLVITLCLLLLSCGVVLWSEQHQLHHQNFDDRILNLKTRVKVLERKIEAELDISQWTYDLAMCESSGRHNVWGDKNYTYPAYGLFQYQERTFNYLSFKLGLEGLEWKNEHHQLILTKEALRNCYGHYWSCYNKIIGI